MIEASVKAIHDMHTKSGVAEAIQALKPIETSKMGIEIAIDEWGPATIAKIAKIRTKLNPETDEGHKLIEKNLALLEETYLKDGYQDLMRGLIP